MDRNELVEKAARAMYVERRDRCEIRNVTRWDSEPQWKRDEYLLNARAALDAILPDVIKQVREEAARIAEEERDLHVAHLGSVVFADTRWEQGGIDAAESIARTIRAAVLGDALKGGK